MSDKPTNPFESRKVEPLKNVETSELQLLGIKELGNENIGFTATEYEVQQVSTH